MSAAGIDFVTYRFRLVVPAGVAPSRSRRPVRLGTKGSAVVPSAHTHDVVKSLRESCSLPRGRVQVEPILAVANALIQGRWWVVRRAAGERRPAGGT
jgi:hypothetical protein